MDIATEIFNQLGGKMFAAMTGSKIIEIDTDSITFKLIRNKSKANELKIVLNGADLYDISFVKHSYPKLNKTTWKYTNEKVEIIREYKDMFCDQLQAIFTETTGLYTRIY